MFEIAKNIPIPEKHEYGREGSPFMQTLRALEVGDSFFFPEPNRKRGWPRIICGAKRLGIKTTARKTNENDIDGFRIWRIA